MENQDLNYEEVYKWVDEQNISRQKRNVHRDFSDAVPLAEILKHHFPKLVELHNYSPASNSAKKLTNWQTLNRKVLCKIGMALSQETMENLAKSKQGVIETVLSNIKTKIEAKMAGDQNECFYDTSGSEESILRRKQGFRTISLSEYQTLEKKLLEKDEVIQQLKSKIEHQESLLKIKEERIEVLTGELNNLLNEKENSSPRARFFSRMF